MKLDPISQKALDEFEAAALDWGVQKTHGSNTIRIVSAEAKFKAARQHLMKRIKKLYNQANRNEESTDAA